MVPPPGWAKINVDAASRQSGYVVACVCHDSFGAIIGASIVRGDSIDPVVGKARGVVFGLQTAVDLGLSSIIVEGDSSIVMDALKSLGAPGLGKFRTVSIILSPL